MKVTCTSIAENHDEIEAALKVLEARSSSKRRLQDSGKETVTSNKVASDVLTMYDCFCDLSNPENIGCFKKSLKFTTNVTNSVDQQAAEDTSVERNLNDIEETIKEHNHNLRHLANLSLARALSELDERVVVNSNCGICAPPGITRTPHNYGYKLCLYAGPIFSKFTSGVWDVLVTFI